ncbi:MAG: hypothetical protein AAFQ76_20310, partial [Cyanobacteria bacterium J06626_26]
MAIQQGSFEFTYDAFPNDPITGTFFIDSDDINPDGFQQVIPLVDPDGDGPLTPFEVTALGVTLTESTTLTPPNAVFNSGELAGVFYAGPSPLLSPPTIDGITSFSIVQGLSTATTDFGPQEA